jgi:hypothetical protein
MYKVSAREVGIFHHNREADDTGVIVSIKPPINLVPEVVTNYLTYGILQDAESNQGGSDGTFGVQLLGSTEEATSIYAGTVKDCVEGAKEELIGSTIELIELLGATAVSAE